MSYAYVLHCSTDDFVRNGLPPKNSKISGSLDSVMTSTTTADNTFDNAPQVGSWVASFDKLLQDPAGVQCFQVSQCVPVRILHVIESKLVIRRYYMTQ